MIPYSKIISLSAILHQVCSSDYVSEAWISLLLYINPSTWGYDLSVEWLAFDYKVFQLLSSLCQLANKTILDARDRFYTQSIITSNMRIESDFYAQLNATFEQFTQSLIIDFGRVVDMMHLFTQVDQPFTDSSNAELNIFRVTDQTNDQLPWQMKFTFTGIEETTSTFIQCICAVDFYCKSSVTAHGYSEDSNGWPDENVTYAVPGMIKSCFTIDTLLLSTLECFYLESCISVIYSLLNETLIHHMTDLIWFQIYPLIYKQESSRFPPNTSLSIIVKEMMIEQWIPSSSFDYYYEQCAPIYCTYSDTTRTYNIIGIITKVISTIGGLIMILHLITPLFVKVIFKLLTAKTPRQEQDIPMSFDRFKQMFRNLITLLLTTLRNLNIFPIRSFGSNITRMEAKHLGQLTTRLYLILLLISFVILSLYTAVRPQTLINTYMQPSLDIYNRLLLDHPDSIQCPCSSISIPYGKFIDIEPVFHQICSSEFVSDEWRTNILAGLVSNLSIYTQDDYRRFLSAHLQFLSGLCNLSKQSTNDSISQFLSSSFVTAHLLPESIFHVQIEPFITKSKSNTPTDFARLLSLLRAISHGNAIITSYGTNFEYIAPWYNMVLSAAITQPVMYNDNQCNCALTANCTIQASFIQANPKKIFQVHGLKMGCIPSESFLLSTLECFYNLSCIDLIQQFTSNNSMMNTSLLSVNDQSHFSMNTTIMDLVQDLFIENWSTTINYPAYFHYCMPLSCSYSYVQKLNSLYTLIVLLGLYGGLTFVLKWICPNLVYFAWKIYLYWKKPNNVVEPVSTIEMNITNTSPRRKFYSSLIRFFIFGFILFILMIITMITTMVYLNRQSQHNYAAEIITATNMTTMTTTTTTMTVSPVSTCPLTFQSIVFYPFGSSTDNGYDWYSIDTGNFNNDGHSDIAITACYYNKLLIWFGNTNRTFETQIEYLTGGLCPQSIVVDDFNNDGFMDIAIANQQSNNIALLFGYGNESFEIKRILSTGSYSQPISIVKGDYNKDGYLDLAVVNIGSSNIAIFLGNIETSSEIPTTFCGTICFYPFSAVADDFNGDDYLDLVAISNADNNDPTDGFIYVLINDGQGNFGIVMKFSIGRISDPYSLSVGDFNSDNHLDLVVTNSNWNNIGIMFGNGNASFEIQVTYSIGVFGDPQTAVVGDFNNDGKSDIAFARSWMYNIGMLIGTGSGSFLEPMMFPADYNGNPVLIASQDFNNDGKLDIIVIDDDLNSIGIIMNTCDCCTSD
ncbi:unnamed protein product [Adineta steineri]|uniref:Uncharacterized protein n=2 Tax=Adineta steineri TaxID=433720 RepID=A0A819EBX1_9BILA|nr:unnamed protein product [Adineta steineri]